MPKRDGKNTTELKGNGDDTHPACSRQPQPALPCPTIEVAEEGTTGQQRQAAPHLLSQWRADGPEGPTMRPTWKFCHQALERAPGQVYSSNVLLVSVHQNLE